MEKVLIATPSFGKFSNEPIEILEKAGFTIVRPAEHPISKEEGLYKYLDDEVMAIINGLEPVGRGVLERAPGLKIIAKHGAGVNNIDLEAAKEFNVMVANAPGANKEGVADLTFGLMLAIARLIPQADACVKSGDWKGFFGSSVFNRTLGIVGMGAIGKCMAQRASGFSMKLLGYDPYWDEDFSKQYNIKRCSLEEILQEADFVTLHVPAMPSTNGMIGEKELRSMKKGAYLINAARGELVDEEALYKVLKEGHLAGAAMDAFLQEPVNPDNPLLTLPNVVVTPHIGMYNDEAMNSTSLAAAKNVVTALRTLKSDEKPRWIVVDSKR